MVSEREPRFDAVTLKKIHEVMSDAVAAVLVYLKNVETELAVSACVLKSWTFMYYRNINHPHFQSVDTFTLAAIRVLGAWIAEETIALRSDVISVLPFVLQVG